MVVAVVVAAVVAALLLPHTYGFAVWVYIAAVIGAGASNVGAFVGVLGTLVPRLGGFLSS